MKVLTIVLAGIILLVTTPVCFAQTAAPARTNTPAPPMDFGLLDGTQVRLAISRAMSSADATNGEMVDFEILEDVKIGEVIVIPRGGVAFGTVREVRKKRRMGRGGILNISIDSVRLSSGQKVAMRAVKDSKGGGRVGAMTGAMVASGILFFPAMPFFLFLKGKNITIAKGTAVTAYISGDIPLDPKHFQPGLDVVESSDVALRSTPEGAEIEIDGKFVGSTPSTVRLKTGDHKITVRKAGFASWERTISVGAGGSIVIDAALEKNP